MNSSAPARRRFGRWLSLGGMGPLLLLLVVHPHDTWAPRAPVTRAAELASSGDLPGARRALALLPVERLRDPEALLVQVCMALEAGELDTASALLLAWDKVPENSPHAEVALLWQLVQVRRQRPTHSWPQALALAWRRVGQPDFSHSRLLPPVGPAGVPEDMLARLWSQFPADEARVLLALAAKPSPERGRFLLQHLSDTRPPEFDLFLIDYLLSAAWLEASGAQSMEVLRPEALTALRAHIPRLAAAHPDAMAPRFATVFLETPDSGPFTPAEVDQLESLSRLPRWRQTDFISLYRYARQQLEVTDIAANSEPNQAAWLTSLQTVGMPLLARVLAKLTASQQSPAEQKQRLGQAFQGIGERLRAENTLIEQLLGMRMLREGALLKGDAAAEQQAGDQLYNALTVVHGTRQVALQRWPLHSLFTSITAWSKNNTSEFTAVQDFSLDRRSPP